ncbi:tryptophan synthase beta subunit-like PLP-dependent enzyme [Saccharata proteae CBS 121410]|uniref:L-serine ammonia-lyase n=1 Tax=Saccharata proteae CBS 121410 TaxID=1314787 RepID=A0A9P4I077_9PEZI|nr:tryptophan synthase beta subunit-like PLP-dependent enzyme [Saccharata proteae CBS 121410]
MSETTVKTWISTPLKESTALSQAAGCRVFLKLENLQPSGSFKSRGIGHYMSRQLATHPRPTSARFYSSSGGNAGLACVHAAIALGRSSTVVVPLSTSASMIAKLRAAGAREVIQQGASWREADAYLRTHVLANDEDGVYVPPFDHPDIWAGNATIVDELSEQLGGEEPGVLVCSVGGGGLFNGLCQGMDRLKWDTVSVLALETRGCDSLNQSLEAGELITLPAITSIAKCLGATRVAEKTFENGKRANVKSVVMDDGEAAMGCWRLADDERMMVELAGGVNVAMCYNGRLERALGKKLNKDSTMVIVLCGGSDITVEMLYELRKKYGQ